MEQPKVVRRRGRIPKAARAEPHMPPEWDPEDGFAIQALLMGRASEAQQKRAMSFIVHNICGSGDLEYRPPEFDPDGRASAFAGGKRFVGLQILKFAQLNIARLRGRETEQGEAPKEQPT